MIRVRKLAWVGVRASNYTEMSAFAKHTLGLRPIDSPTGGTLFELEDGTKFALFSDASPHTEQYGYGPVPGLLVDDVNAAARQLRDAGLEIVYGPDRSDRGMAWVDFRAPDGHIYELIEDAAQLRADTTAGEP